jgi:hypothetical protein
MKVICISGSRFLIKGKIYEVESERGDMYVLSRKEPLSSEQYEWNSTWFSKMNFETIEDKRNRRLEELGI